jgi:hypothetical protein
LDIPFYEVTKTEAAKTAKVLDLELEFFCAKDQTNIRKRNFGGTGLRKK